jgi:transcriptional regulator with XRE-family HTH domain
MALGPTVRRRRLGTELRRLRERNGFKLEEVASHLGVAPSTLSRIETGKAPTKSAYLTSMLGLYEVTDPQQRQVLIDMAREGHRKGWWSVYEDVLPSGFGIYVGLEGEAAGLRSFEANVLHGLLQTQEYARALLSEMHTKYTPEQVERLVDLRIERQERLGGEPAVDLWVIHDEAVIRRVVGGAAVMRRQLDHLLRAGQQTNITLQVLPFESGAHAGLRGPFSIIEFPEPADPEVVYVESAGGIIYIEKDKEVRMYSDAFDRLRASALSPAASADLTERMVRELALAAAGSAAAGEVRKQPLQ